MGISLVNQAINTRNDGERFSINHAAKLGIVAELGDRTDCLGYAVFRRNIWLVSQMIDCFAL